MLIFELIPTLIVYVNLKSCVNAFVSGHGKRTICHLYIIVIVIISSMVLVSVAERNFFIINYFPTYLVRQ